MKLQDTLDLIDTLLAEPPVKAALVEWATWRWRESGKRLTKSGLVRTMTHYNGQHNNLVADIKVCLEEEWKGLKWAEAERLKKLGPQPSAQLSLPAGAGRKKQFYRFEKYQRADGSWSERRIPHELDHHTSLTVPYKKLSPEICEKLDRIYKKSTTLNQTEE